jgi:hypothetical protein
MRLLINTDKRIFSSSMNRAWVDRERSLESDNELLRFMFEEMRATDEVTPVPGFYERVRSRIEQLSQQSIWMPFVYPHFPKRFVAALLGVSLVLLGYTVAGEWYTNGPEHIANSGSANVISTATLDPQQQRDVVLMQIATYRRPD